MDPELILEIIKLRRQVTITNVLFAASLVLLALVELFR
jgi:hypothetical protein